MKIKKGFSLLELILVLGVGAMVAFMKFQDMKNEQESIMASAVGQQMKQIGEAVNGYINKSSYTFKPHVWGKLDNVVKL